MSRAELPNKIETERLVLRVRTVADSEDIFDYASLLPSRLSTRQDLGR